MPPPTYSLLALTGIKDAISLASSINQLPIKEKLNDAYTALNGLIHQQGEIEIELHNSKRRIRELEETAKLAAQMELVFTVYWKRIDESRLEGPYSPIDYSEGKLVPLKCTMIREGEAHYQDSRNKMYTVPLEYLKRSKAMNDEEVAHFTDEKPPEVYRPRSNWATGGML